MGARVALVVAALLAAGEGIERGEDGVGVLRGEFDLGHFAVAGDHTLQKHGAEIARREAVIDFAERGRGRKRARS